MSSETTLLLLASLLVPHPHAPGDSSGANVLSWHGSGTQVYACELRTGGYGWTFERPDATLSNSSGTTEAHHGAGPSWTATDGSKVVGKVIASMPSPAEGAVPWLALQASAHSGHGVLDSAAFILRTDTAGGVAPSSGCDEAHAGATVKVPYHATYSFVLPHAGATPATADDLARKP
jgi:hypothetical protein